MPHGKIPVTIIGGYLGVGKTTLLNNLIRAESRRRLAVLVNDFGSINIDADLIADRAGGVVSLANGCICCSIGDDLGFALLDVADLDPAPEHIVIEASGIANPARVRGIISMLAKMQVEATVVVADAADIRRCARDKQIGRLIHDQLAAADLLVLNKIDLATATTLRDTEAWLAADYPKTVVVQSTNAALPGDLILGTTASIKPKDPQHHRHGPEFAHALFESERLLDRQAFRAALDALPPGILRGKGFVRFSDNPGAAEVLQLVGSRWSLAPAEQDKDRRNTSRLSFIALAKGFDSKRLLDGLAAAEE